MKIQTPSCNLKGQRPGLPDLIPDCLALLARCVPAAPLAFQLVFNYAGLNLTFTLGAFSVS